MYSKNTEIIIFTGLPGTGKTTLSRKVATALGMPLLAKDGIKEIMFDKIGWTDKAFSAKLAQATFGIMDYVTEQHLKSGVPTVLEANLSPALSSQKFQTWQEQYGCTIVQIVCRTDTEVLAQRCVGRQQSDRHPGHLDIGTAADYRTGILHHLKEGGDQPLDVDGPVLIIDTTDFGTVNSGEIVQWIRSNTPAYGHKL